MNINNNVNTNRISGKNYDIQHDNSVDNASSLPKTSSVPSIANNSETNVKISDNKINVYQNSHVKDQHEKEKLDQVVNDFNKKLANNHIQAIYFKDENTGQTVFQLKDTEKNEVIKQIPSKQMLAVSQEIDKFLDTYNNKGNQDKSGVVSTMREKA